jgi:hypothetical protein
MRSEMRNIKETDLPRIDAPLCAQFEAINRIQKRKQIDDVPAPAALAALVLPPPRLVVGDDEDDNVGCSGVSLTEERLLCVCRLIITAGQRLEADEKGRVKLRMSFDRLDAASAMGNAAYSSNVRSALKDLRELRKTGWVHCNGQLKQKVAGN